MIHGNDGTYLIRTICDSEDLFGVALYGLTWFTDRGFFNVHRERLNPIAIDKVRLGLLWFYCAFDDGFCSSSLQVSSYLFHIEDRPFLLHFEYFDASVHVEFILHHHVGAFAYHCVVRWTLRAT